MLGSLELESPAQKARKAKGGEVIARMDEREPKLEG